MVVFCCFFNSEIPVNFQFKKADFAKYFCLITMAECQEHFDEVKADFQR